MADLSSITSDLADEHAALDGILDDLDDTGWETLTPAEPWTVRDQISHLAFFDEQALLAATDPAAFAESLVEIAKDIEGFVDESRDRGRAIPARDVLEWWRSARGAMMAAFADLDPHRRIAWYGPPMSPSSFVTARLMETWAHGQDIVDALGIEREPTDRLKHVCYIGVRARTFSYVNRGMEVPSEPVGVVLRAPSGETWSWDEGAAERIEGGALGFCLVVTQRRHPVDTDLVATGPLAEEWLSIAQSFAGPPGGGRKPGQFNKVTA